MKHISIIASAVLFLNTFSFSQSKAGSIIYEVVGRSDLVYETSKGKALQPMTSTVVRKFQLDFDSLHSIWKKIDWKGYQIGTLILDEIRLAITTTGPKDILYTDFSPHKVVEQIDDDALFIVDDTMQKLNWQIFNDPVTYMNRTCYRAIASKTQSLIVMSMHKGKVESKKVSDTVNISALYTLDFPVPAGPSIFGGLPGLVLELDIADGRQVFSAVEISETNNSASIIAPIGQKRYTREEYNEEKEKRVKSSRENKRRQ